MNTQAIGMLLGLLATVLMCAWLYRIYGHRGTKFFANIAEGVHEGSKTVLTDAAITRRFLLYTKGTNDNHVAVNTSASGMPIGTIADEATAAEEEVALKILGKGTTTRMVNSGDGTIAVADEVYAASGGKVQKRPSGAGTYWRVGAALTAATTENDIIEVADAVPFKLVI